MSVNQTPPTAREKAIEAYDSARDSVTNAGRKAGDGIDQAPLVALAGGLAVGALLAVLLPAAWLEELGWQVVPAGDVRQWDGLVGWFVEYVKQDDRWLTDKYIRRWHRVALDARNTASARLRPEA